MSEALVEVLNACAGILLVQRWRLLATFAVVLTVALLEGRLRRGGERWLRAVFGATLGGALVVGVWLGWKKLWLCDDAFITFRYAWNLAHGNGLVFNPGEWVEGYTNFLWAVVLGGLGRLGVDIPYAGLFGNVLAFALVLVLAGLTVMRASPQSGPGSPVVPWSVVALAGSAAFTTWVSSGLETMPAALCVMGAVFLVAAGGSAWLAGLSLAAAALMRPDHLLFAPAMGVAFLVEDLLHEGGVWWRRPRWKRLLSLAAPVTLIFVPYWLIRWRVYGDFFPNTYYAKSGGETYLSQGWVYLTHYLATTGAWLGMPLLAVLAFARPRSRAGTALSTFALAGALLLASYVVRVGGDFMEQRFLIVLLPVLAVALEVSLRLRLASATPGGWRIGARVVALLGLVAVAVALVPVRPIGPLEKRWMLAAEETFYPVTRLFPLAVGSGLFDKGKALARAFPESGPTSPRLAEGCVGFISYYSKLPIIDTYGLANRRIAHKPLQQRGRPGHEKYATLEDLLAEDAVISAGPAWPGRDAQTGFEVQGWALHFVQYDPAVAASAARGGGRAPDLDGDIRRAAGTRSRDELLATLEFYRRFLAKVPDREARLAPLTNRLASVEDFEGTLPSGSTAQGEVEVLRGTPPRGGSGHGWLSMGQGRFELPVPQGVRALRFALGGTASPSVGVRLEAGARVLAQASPETVLELSPFEWALEEPAPAGARLVAFVGEPGGRLLLDAVRVAPSAEGQTLANIEALPAGEVFELLRAVEEELPAGDPRVRKLRGRLAARWSFDDDALPAGFRVTGGAFHRPATGAAAGQQALAGRQGGRLLNSFDPGDAATGRLEADLPAGEQVLVGALVGGGSDCRHVYLGLRVNGEMRARVCGNQDEVLRPVVLTAEVSPGEAIELVMVDEATGPWGHLLVDDVQVVALPSAHRVAAEQGSR
ncbi:MAG: hypothetical protein ACYC8T_08340 [Myxococcaceae bacterium]